MAAKKKTAKPVAKKSATKAPAKPAKKAAAPAKKAAKPVAKKAPAAKKTAKKVAVKTVAKKSAAKPAKVAVKPAPAKKPAAKKPAAKAPVAKKPAVKAPASKKPAAKAAAVKAVPKAVAAPVKKAPAPAAQPAKAVAKPAAKVVVAAAKPAPKLPEAPGKVYAPSKPEISLADMEAAPTNGQHHAPSFVAKQKQRLLDLRDELVDAMSGMTRDTIRNAPEGSEASGSGMHQGDAGSDAYDRDFALSVLAKEQDSLYEIDQALHRIKKSVYGICEISGKKIPQARLEAIPFARLTVECQAQWEKEYGNRRFRPSNEVGFSGGSYNEDEDSDTVSLDEDED